MKDTPRTVSAPLVFACLLVFLLSSSALGQSTSPRVTVWLYRPAVDNFGFAMPLYVDGKKMVGWGPGQYFGIQLSPGLHAFSWTNAPGARQVVLPIAADAQSYLEVTYLSAAPFMAINPLPADKAMAAMSGLRPIDSNAAFVDGVIIPAQRLQIPATAALNGSEIASSRATAPAPKVADPAPAIATLPSASSPPPPVSAGFAQENQEAIKRILISELDSKTGRVTDDWVSRDMLNWLREGSKKVQAGKVFPRYRAATSRADADYVLLWSRSQGYRTYVTYQPHTSTELSTFNGSFNTSGYDYTFGSFNGVILTRRTYYTENTNTWPYVDVTLLVYDKTGRKVYETWHQGNWRWSKPDKDCLVDALRALGLTTR